MAKDLRKGLGIALVAFASMFSFVSNVNAVSCPNGSLRAGEGDVGSISECNLAKDHAGANDLMGTVNIIINVVLGVLGLLAVVVIIYGGFMYTTSAGDSSKIKKAKDTIMYGVIGLVIALLAFAIVNFVVSSIFK
jgi:hypothetical protein cdivTM_30108